MLGVVQQQCLYGEDTSSRVAMQLNGHSRIGVSSAGYAPRSFFISMILYILSVVITRLMENPESMVVE